MKDSYKKLYYVLFVLAIAVNFAGINVKFFSDDQGLYASIAKNLIYKKDFFQLFTYNLDWLDKPHFPFWVIMLSFKLFGICTWAYRLPALLFFMLSVLYTWLFTKKYYGWETAAIAVLILMTAQHIILSNTDVRAEPYLMALITGGIYHVSRLDERFTLADLLLAALFTACAIMTKGIFVIGAIWGSAFGAMLIQGRLKELFRFKWLFLVLLTAMFTLPEFYALYIQFDLHPEKLVFGKHNVSGIHWFLWDSQFGRFANNGPIKQQTSGSIFFFMHTLLWAFAPWCLLFYYAVFKRIKSIFKREKLAEYYSLSGGLILLCLFSLSRFQLPFYTNSVFPMFAIITAPFCCGQLTRFGAKFRLTVEWLFAALLIIAVIALNILLKPIDDLPFWVGCIFLVLILMLVMVQVKEVYKRAFFFCCAAALFAGFFLNNILFNEIVPYKGEIAAAEYINQTPFDNVHIYSLKAENNIFQFYCKRPVDYIPIDQFDQIKLKDTSVFYVKQQSMDYLLQTHAHFRILTSFVNYPQENMLPAFINSKTRNTTLGQVYLITK